MKKLLALVLASVLLLGVPVAYGTEYSGWGEGTSLSPTSQVMLQIEKSDDSFVIVIPATLEVDFETMTGSMDVTLKGGYQLYSTTMKVSLVGSANGMKLVSGDNELAYTLHVTGPEGLDKDVTMEQLAQGVALFRTLTTSGSSDISVTITVTVTGTPTSVGTYTDTLTFKVQ